MKRIGQLGIFVALILSLLQMRAPSAQPDARWIILSDIHFNPLDTSPANSISTGETNGAMLDATIAYMKQRQPDASVVVIAGNFLEHRFEKRVHTASPHLDTTVAAENSMRTIAQRFAAAFPQAQFVIALGNDDNLCEDAHAEGDSSYLHAQAKIWEPLVNRNGSAPNFLQTFGAGGYYVTRIGEGHLRAIVANTTYWTNDGCPHQQEHLGADELRWFESTLGSTAHDDFNLVLLHHPPGVVAFANAVQTGIGALTYFNEASNQAITQIIADPKYHVAAVIAGHVGRTEFRWFHGIPLLIVPSIARPIRGIRMFFIADTNPSDSLTQSSPTLINDFAAFVYRDNGQWGGAYDYADAFNESAFDAAAVQDIHKQLYQGWHPPASTYFTADATTYCAQDELANDYLSCIDRAQRGAP